MKFSTPHTAVTLVAALGAPKLALLSDSLLFVNDLLADAGANGSACQESKGTPWQLAASSPSQPAKPDSAATLSCSQTQHQQPAFPAGRLHTPVTLGTSAERSSTATAICQSKWLWSLTPRALAPHTHTCKKAPPQTAPAPG